MYAIAIIRYRRSLEGAEDARDEHRKYLLDLKKKGLLIASGPFEPHFGGALLLRIPDLETLDRIRDEDPFTKLKVAQYELQIWNVKTGKDDLDGIG
ncbi:MAG: YciI family protein [Desulfitobacterium hafniense]|nr:YciI family protein [Desulfitobacterium hafniense]